MILHFFGGNILSKLLGWFDTFLAILSKFTKDFVIPETFLKVVFFIYVYIHKNTIITTYVPIFEI